MVGGINSEIMRQMKISVRNLKLGQGKHTTHTKHVKYSCARKRKLADPVSKKCTRVLDFFSVNGTPGLLGNIVQVTDLWVINAKNADGYGIETVCFVIF